MYVIYNGEKKYPGNRLPAAGGKGRGKTLHRKDKYDSLEAFGNVNFVTQFYRGYNEGQ